MIAQAPFEDLDDDLLPDDWERVQGCDPSDPADAMEDFDADGLINLQEFLYGTDPFEPDTNADGILHFRSGPLAPETLTPNP